VDIFFKRGKNMGRISFSDQKNLHPEAKKKPGTAARCSV
jgi:hypothetical protein